MTIEIINAGKITAAQKNIALLMQELQKEEAIRLLKGLERLIASNDGDTLDLTEALWLLEQCEILTLCRPAEGSWAVDDLVSPYGSRFALITRELCEACEAEQPTRDSYSGDYDGDYLW